jgi:hypothetical protein
MQLRCSATYVRRGVVCPDQLWVVSRESYLDSEHLGCTVWVVIMVTSCICNACYCSHNVIDLYVTLSMLVMMDAPQHDVSHVVVSVRYADPS